MLIFKGWTPAEAIETFKAASEAYQILMSTDKQVDFHKDWTHLERRWKVENWTWHRLFIIDRSINDKNYDHAIIELSKLIKQTTLPPRVLSRCKAQLGSCYYALKKVRSSVRPFIESLMLLKEQQCEIECSQR